MGKKKNRKDNYREFIIPTVISTAISIVGFLIYNFYFLPNNIHKEFKRDMYMQLLSETSIIYDQVNSSNNAILSEFSTYGLQSKDLDSVMKQYYENIKKVKSLNSKLRSMGNEEQIKFNNNFLEELWFPYQLMSIHKNKVKSFERLIGEGNQLINQKMKDTVLFKRTLSELDSIIKNENKLFFELRDYYLPRLNDLARFNNYYYRKELGLNITSDIIDAQEDIIKLDSLHEEFKYFTHKYEYTTARARHLINYKVDLGDSIINQLVKMEILNKFLIYNDKI